MDQDLKARIDALPEYPRADAEISDGMFYRRMSAAYSQRLALAREWIAANGHAKEKCLTGESCICGRDALLKALEVPRG
jgi:hypothetical protein